MKAATGQLSGDGEGMNGRPHPFLTIGFVVGLSLGVAVVLFKVLDSTGQFNIPVVSFGGGAAGFEVHCGFSSGGMTG